MSDHTFNHFMDTITRIADEISGDEQFVIPALVQDFREKAHLAERYAEEIMTQKPRPENRHCRAGQGGKVLLSECAYL